MLNWLIYCYISPSGKKYIGKTSVKRENKRKAEHKYKAKIKNGHFQNAVNKYGIDNFIYFPVAYCATEQEAFDVEKYLISKYKTNDKNYGYNLTDGGEGTSGISRYGSKNSFYGKHHTEETKRKISEANKGKVCFWKGKKLSDEHKKNMSISRIGKSHHTQEWINELKIRYGRDNNPAAKPVEYYSTNSSFRSNFKSVCRNRMWNFDDFKEVFAETYTKPNGKKENRYYYIYGGTI